MFDILSEMGHEQVIYCHDPAAGYRGIIAIHSTVLGPAAGGTRCWNYASDEDALRDVLRLSRGMTYKNAVAGIPLGGGKAVILGDPARGDREAIFRAHGRFVEQLGGRFITAEDVGTSPADLEIAARESRFVRGIAGRGGDPSPWTARGVFRGIQASARHRWGADELAGKIIALQGCGNVGHGVAKHLAEAGATLIVSDVDARRARRCVDEFGATAVGPDEIYGVRADVFAPCALGAVLNDRTIAQLQVEIVAGAANNQLQEEGHGEVLERRGVLYAPDYVINAGGVISGSASLFGESEERLAARVDGIYDTLRMIYEHAAGEGVPTALAADRLAEQRLQSALGAQASSPADGQGERGCPRTQEKA
jgi:leucine dehydrogenase